MKLVIAEKPSVGNAIAKVLGVNGRKDGYIEGNGYVISWCVGHLVGLANTECYDEKYAKWNLCDLPIIPEKWEYAVQSGKEKQLDLLCKLLDRVDVKEVVNACDSGREGELIFRLVYNYSGSSLPIKRLWISSMEDNAILDGFANLKDNSQYQNLYQSAVCRQCADWLVGINGTRLFSSLYYQTLNVGRVMSPTLAMIVQRNYDIDNFKTEPFYKIKAERNGIKFFTDKFTDKNVAENILKECEGNAFVIENVERKEKTEKSPKLFDLTTLQRVCNRELGYTASQTLDYVQKLYEKKLCTYPRTDSRFVTEDMHETVKEVLDCAYDFQGVEGNDVCDTSKVINNSKVSDHHAIIPTKNINGYDFSQLDKGELDVLRKIIQQLICSLSSDYKYDETIITAKCGDYVFTVKDKIATDLGFKSYLGKEETESKEEDGDLSIFEIGSTFDDVNLSIEEGQTTPPKQFTEDTLLYSMESAGKSEEVDKQYVGIGTPATRSSIIEKLEKQKFIERVSNKGKKANNLLPTKKGIALVTVLPDVVKSSLTTAYWEEQLKNVENGDINADDFMTEVNDMVVNLVKNYEKVAESEKLFGSKYETIGCCPRCKSDVVDTPKAFSCVSKECGFALWKENKFFQSIKQTLTKKIAKDLLGKGKVHLSNCYSQKTDKIFSCDISIEDTGKYVNYKMSFDDKKRK